MDILELGAIGELVGGVAVIGSLLFVGLQVRQSNRLAQADSIRGFQGDFSAALEGMVADPQLLTLVLRASQDFANLSNEEKSRVHLVSLRYMMVAQNSYMLKERGLADEQIHELAIWSAAGVVAQPGMREWWAESSRNLDPKFVAEINDALARPETIPLTDLLGWWKPDATAAQEA